MALFNPRIVPSQGWRRTGIFNVALAFSCCLLLFILFCISLLQQDDYSRMGTTQVYRGLCKDTSRLNTVLHLVLNIISTGILASSNFFMQIVTSPSRAEIDQAHAYLKSLDIGFQSLRNMSTLSYFKRILWLLLFLTSIPIHLFFNSAIYETKYLSHSFNLTIATNRFLDGGEYWLPGASLSPSGSSSPVQSINHSSYSSLYYHNPDTPSWLSRFEITGFGHPVDLGEYLGSSQNGTLSNEPRFDPAPIIDKTAKDGHNWVHLDAQRCMAEYRTFEPRTELTSVIIIVHTGLPEPNGWKRVDVYEFDSDHEPTPTPNNPSSMWNASMPPLKVNSLWSWNRCYVGEENHYSKGVPTIIRRNTCGRLLGLGSETPDWDTIPKDVKTISFSDDGMNGTTQSAEATRGYIPKIRTLQIDHCLAEEYKSCQVRVANALLLVVIACVIAKVAICIALLRYLKTTSLVTPGDVIESFISIPDPVTRGLATLSMYDVQVLDYSRRQHHEEVDDPLVFQPPARRWQGGSKRLKSAIPRGIWVQLYYPAFLALSVLLVGVIFSSTGGESGMSLDKFGPSTKNNDVLQIFDTEPSYLGVLLTTNSPQLIFSFCYLAINLLFTQLQVEQEWNSYAGSYRPLRVSYPVGDQISTYRLQLPYKYSVPLIVTSTIMHWLISRSIYLIAIEGDSGFPRLLTNLQEYLGVTSEAAIAIGYSNLSVLITFVFGCIIVITPLFFRRRKLQSEMVLGGTNSLVLSAACHVPVPLQSSPQSSETPGLEDNDAEAYLKKVSRGKVRWGAAPLPPDTFQQQGESGTMEGPDTVMHLGFAGPDQAVEAPQKGQLYM